MREIPAFNVDLEQLTVVQTGPGFDMADFGLVGISVPSSTGAKLAAPNTSGPSTSVTQLPKKGLDL